MQCTHSRLKHAPHARTARRRRGWGRLPSPQQCWSLISLHTQRRGPAHAQTRTRARARSTELTSRTHERAQRTHERAHRTHERAQRRWLAHARESAQTHTQRSMHAKDRRISCAPRESDSGRVCCAFGACAVARTKNKQEADQASEANQRLRMHETSTSRRERCRSWNETDPQQGCRCTREGVHCPCRIQIPRERDRLHDT